MHIYMFVTEPHEIDESEQDVIEEKRASLEAAVQAFVGEGNLYIQFVNEGERLGITANLKRAKHLNEPLKALYAIAKEHKCDFVTGVIDGDTYEDVCYFGCEEGKPDPFEISSYLGFES